MGATAEARGLEASVVTVLVVAFAAVAGLWWTYFDWVATATEHRLAREDDARRRGNLARDLYTLGHLPLVAGTVVLAAAVEEALVVPDEPLHGLGVAALWIGPSLFLVGFAIGNLRASGTWLWGRLAGVAAIVVLGAVASHVDAAVSIGALALVIAAVAVAERDRPGELARSN